VGDAFDLGGLSTGDVTSYVLAECQRGPISYTKGMSSPLRCLLRFLFVEGLVERDLSGAVPSAPDRRLNSLPKAISAVDVARLLASCDCDTVTGRRDFAMITMLSRLGLRAGETAALLVSDIDWRRGELVVRGKANRFSRLPLPVDVGEAVVAWLQHGRPHSVCRHVFTRLRAPVGPLSNAGVSMVVSRACQRAGLPVMHAHRLRHTVATETLHAGGSLLEVAQLLRHSGVGTATIYARVDRHGLSAVVRPWPGVQT
jgi:site-specific recombinase XerD